MQATLWKGDFSGFVTVIYLSKGVWACSLWSICCENGCFLIKSMSKHSHPHARKAQGNERTCELQAVPPGGPQRCRRKCEGGRGRLLWFSFLKEDFTYKWVCYSLSKGSLLNTFLQRDKWLFMLELITLLRETKYKYTRKNKRGRKRKTCLPMIDGGLHGWRKREIEVQKATHFSTIAKPTKK